MRLAGGAGGTQSRAPSGEDASAPTGPIKRKAQGLRSLVLGNAVVVQCAVRWAFSRKVPSHFLFGVLRRLPAPGRRPVRARAMVRVLLRREQPRVRRVKFVKKITNGAHGGDLAAPPSGRYKHPISEVAAFDRLVR